MVKLKVSTRLFSQQHSNISEQIVQAFIMSCMKLDASIFEPLMNEEDVFEEKEKYLFLAQLKEIFEDFRQDTLDEFKVTMKETTCNGCEPGKQVKHFEIYHSQSGRYAGDFAFLIDVDNGRLKDIYQCYDYAGCKKCTIGNKDGSHTIEISLPLYQKSIRDSLKR